MLIELIRLKCDKLVDVSNDLVELRAQEADAAPPSVIWGPEPYTTLDEWATDHSVRGKLLETTVAFDSRAQIALLQQSDGGTRLTTETVLTVHAPADDDANNAVQVHRFEFPGQGHYTLSYRVVATREEDTGSAESGRPHRARSAVALVARDRAGLAGAGERAANVLAPGEWGLVFYPRHNKPGKSDASSFRAWATQFATYHDRGPNTAARVIWIDNGVNDARSHGPIFNELMSKLEEVYMAMQYEPRLPPMSFIAFFCHGYSNGFQLGIPSAQSATRTPQLGGMIAALSRPDVVVPMYACSTGGATRAADGGASNFAGKLRDALVDAGAVHCRVIGHTTAGRADISRDVRIFEGSERGQGGHLVARLGGPLFQKGPLFQTWADAILDEESVSRVLHRQFGRNLRAQEGGDSRFIDDPNFRWRYPFMSMEAIRNWLEHRRAEHSSPAPAGTSGAFV